MFTTAWIQGISGLSTESGSQLTTTAKWDNMTPLAFPEVPDLP